MNCVNCGALLNESSHCPQCGFDVVVQKKAYLLSNIYYNQGLEKAEIRDLSGAIDLLKRSLKFNKLNVQARNLLGLVYFETGEAVAALSEWVISKNIMPEGNIAAEYIDRLQANANKLDSINHTIKKYNEALGCCRNGSADVAVIQLKKILTQNPKLIKAYHLLALNYLHDKEYEKARRILKKAAKIDKTNSTTLRFLREVDEQTGTHTNLESRWNFGRSSKREGREEHVPVNEVIMPPAFRESSVFSTVLNIGFGLIVGAFVVWFLFVPARVQSINREANDKVTEYSNTMASQAAELSKMEDKIKESEETVNSARDQIAEADERVTSYENLIKSWSAYQEESYTNAANSLSEVDVNLLSVDAKAIYDKIYADIRSTLFARYKEDGIEAFDHGDYETAIEQLTQAMEIDDTDYEVLNYLAHSYRESQDTQNAVKLFEKIIEQNPETRRASSAQAYIDAINSGEDILDADTEQAEPAEETSGDSQDSEQAGSEETGDEGSQENYEE